MRRLAMLLTLVCGCSAPSGAPPEEADGGEPPSPAAEVDAGADEVDAGSPDVVTKPPPPDADAAPTPCVPVGPKVKLEVEDGTLNGVTVARARAPFSGAGYVAGFKDNAPTTVTVSVRVEKTGPYAVGVGYASEYDDKLTNLQVDGGPAIAVRLPKTRAFKEATAGRVLLTAGEHTLTLGNGWGWYELDYVSVGEASSCDAYAVPDVLVTPNASPEARAVFRFLRSIYGKKTLAGQQDPLDFEAHLVEVTGKRPALGAFDFWAYSPMSDSGGQSSDTDKMIEWGTARKGLVSASWHWYSPTGSLGKPNRGSFYTDNAAFDLVKGLDPSTEEHRLLLRDVDAIAVQLKRLEAARVPVLFRPLHEAEGGWFWWGAKGPEPAKRLWRLLFDRYTRHHGLKNLIWVWNSVAKDWYPGPEYVDVLSVDVYNAERSYDPASALFDELVALGEKKKLVAMAENGPMPDPDLMQQLDVHWAWFSTWNKEFILTERYTTNAQKRRVFTSEHVLTLDELPDIFAGLP